MNIGNSATAQDLAILRTIRSLILDDLACAYENSGQEVARITNRLGRLRLAFGGHPKPANEGRLKSGQRN